MTDQPDAEVGPVTGLPLDLPFGQHPADWYIAAMQHFLGPEKTARFFGYEIRRVTDVAQEQL